MTWVLQEIKLGKRSYMPLKIYKKRWVKDQDSAIQICLVTYP